MAGATPPQIEIVQTVPTRIMMHTIDDHQLNALTNVSRPLTLAGAGATFGAGIGLLPSVFAGLHRVGTTSFQPEDLACIVLDAIFLIATVYFGWRAYAGERDARRMVKDIKGRPYRSF